jgi:hypothetical protein
VPQWDKYLNVSGDYMGVLCIPPAINVPCIHKITIQFSMSVYIFKASFYNGRMNTLKFADDIVSCPTGKLHISRISRNSTVLIYVFYLTIHSIAEIT